MSAARHPLAWVAGAALAFIWALPGLAADSSDSVDSYRASAQGLIVEISAPRDDVIRVRAGRGRLPEDASWAVPPGVRTHRQTMALTQTGPTVQLRTAALIVRLNTATLELEIDDVAGHVVLADAPRRALVITPGAAGAPDSIELRKQMPADAHYFGLGDKTGPLDRRGGAFTLWNTDASQFSESTDPLYKSIPFMLGVAETGGSVGVLFDNTWRSHFDFGKSERDTLLIGAEGGPVDYYVLAAADPKTVIETYAKLTGTAPLAPLWALGFQQSRYSYATESEARAIARRLRSDRIPADVLYLDIDYQDRNRPFTVSSQAFPDLPGFIADLGAMHLHTVLITDLHIARAPDEHYAPYDSGAAQGVFLARPDGSTYVGKVWPGDSVFPDFSRASVREWWGGLYADFVRAGAAGFWNDMNEPALFDVRSKTMPLDTVHRIEEAGFEPREASHAEMHNVYGMLNSRATYEGLLKLAPDRRPFVLTRASYAGGQRYAATWIGDNTSTWNHLRLSIAMLNNLGLSGFAYAGDDIGGFSGPGPSPELLTRWIEIGAFNPIFRDHCEKGKTAQEPWVGGPIQEAIRRRYIEERYRLMPYLYALAEENSRTGLPLMRPVFLEFPQQLSRADGPGGNAGQFMLGPDLLVTPAPIGESPDPYLVSLPGSGWYDYWTGLRQSLAEVTETPRLDRLPVWVRPGSIIPREPLVQSTAEMPRGNLQLWVYPGPDCVGHLYVDDGVSFAYRSGDYLRQSIRCRTEENVTIVEFDAREGRYQPWWHEIELTVHGVAGSPRRVVLGERTVASRFDAKTQTLHIRLPDQPGIAQLSIEAAQ